MTNTGDDKEASGSPSKVDPSDAHVDEDAGSAHSTADASDQFNRKLREVYSDVLDAPVPDRFLDLLAKLDEKSASKKDSGSS